MEKHNPDCSESKTPETTPDRLFFPPPTLPVSFLTRLVTELDDESVRAIILHGSYVRGDAHPPYSDIDLVRIMQETVDHTPQKCFLWHDGYLLNLSSRPLSVYQHWLTRPEEAIFRVQTIREAHILLEKDEAFRRFQQEAQAWQWEPLQQEANAYASHLLLEQTEIVLKILRALREADIVALLEMMLLDLLNAVTEAVAVQRGILVKSGNSYLRQVQHEVGMTSAWTQAWLAVAGAPGASDVPSTVEQRGKAALHLYQETVRLLGPALLSEDAVTIEPILRMITDRSP